MRGEVSLLDIPHQISYTRAQEQEMELSTLA